MIASQTRSRFVLLVALGCALGVNLGFAAGQLDSLLSNSPFGSAKSGQPADAGTQPLEFRGVLEENGQQIFSIYDTATKRSRWVGLNAASDDFVVKSYDAAANSISLEQHGRVLSLALKSGPKVASNVAMNLPSSMPQPGVNGQPAQVLPNGAMGKGPEAQRLQQIAEEIRRRRALRQQAPQMPVPTPNGTSATGGPTFTPGSGSGPMPIPNSGSGPGPTPMPSPSSSSGPMPVPSSGSSSGPMPTLLPGQTPPSKT